jgi:UDP-N-acetylmuramyl pentapeptide phosphotransferase/UDP-N-acetylglucosamine-1-phosphate transferase
MTMLLFTVAFAASLLATTVIVRYAGVKGVRLLDDDLRGVQKMHILAVPRVGGVGIAFAAVLASVLAGALEATPKTPALLLACSAPALAAGFIEDVTKHVSPRARLLCVMAAALLACLILGAVIERVDLPIGDAALTFIPLAIAFTVVAVAGLTNALNIIDGINGLASVVGIFIFASIAYVAYRVGDAFVTRTSLIMIGSVGGFVVWNYPAGLVFLGDGGAYFIGFMIAELLVLLLAAHPSISAWYALLVSIYPTWETLFSMYRRKVVRGMPIDVPDRVHLHTLMYKRVRCRGMHACEPRKSLRRNSGTSPYLWLLALLGVVPATLFWHNGVLMVVLVCLFIALYVWLYAAIVRFRTPRWLFVRSIAHTATVGCNDDEGPESVRHSKNRESSVDVS